MKITTANIQNPCCSLRRNYLYSFLDYTDYCINAARLYCNKSLYLRAEAIIETLSESELNPDQKNQYSLVKESITNLRNKKDHPECSFTMITKNEEDNIIDALESIDNAADEIIICDTGSTDKTVSLARLFGAKIITDNWQDDFSRPRNLAINEASCEWIFWMDADDRLDPESSETIKNIWLNSSFHGASVRVLNNKKNRGSIEFMQVRAFPNNINIRFEKRIHEQVIPNIKKSGLPFKYYPDITITHTGYFDESVHKRKAERNRALIKTELSENPDDPSLLLSLGDSYFVLDRITRAIEVYKRICYLEDIYYINKDIYVQAHVNAGLLSFRMNNIHDAKKYFFRSLYLDNTRIESYYHLAKIFMFQENNINKAFPFFLKSARITPPLRLTASNNLIIKLEALYYLSEVLIKMKYYDNLKDMLLSAVKEFPNVPRFYSQLGKTMLLLNQPVEAMKHFKHSLSLSLKNNQEAFIGLAEVCRITCDREGFTCCLEKGLQHCRKNNLLKEYILDNEHYLSRELLSDAA